MIDVRGVELFRDDLDRSVVGLNEYDYIVARDREFGLVSGLE